MEFSPSSDKSHREEAADKTPHQFLLQNQGKWELERETSSVRQAVFSQGSERPCRSNASELFSASSQATKLPVPFIVLQEPYSDKRVEGHMWLVFCTTCPHTSPGTPGQGANDL